MLLGSEFSSPDLVKYAELFHVTFIMNEVILEQDFCRSLFICSLISIIPPLLYPGFLNCAVPVPVQA
jgi:hypothetical protein